jgi:HSP20 family molecular chaperone IbpA
MLGSFARTMRIGDRLDPDRAEASYAHGILRVRLARAPEAAPKKISITS